MDYTVDNIPKPYIVLRRHVASEHIIYVDKNKSYITIAVCYSKDSILLYQSFAASPKHLDYIVIETKKFDAIKKAALGLQPKTVSKKEQANANELYHTHYFIANNRKETTL